MSYEIRPEAEGEYLEALVYYGTRRPESVLEFEAEFESLIERISQGPRAYLAVAATGVRRALMRGFPYTVYFREIEDGIEIIAVSHQSRRFGYWLDRIYPPARPAGKRGMLDYDAIQQAALHTPSINGRSWGSF